MTTTCLLAWAVALLLLPCLILAWAFETPGDRARRWRQQGMTQQAIANRLGCSRTGPPGLSGGPVWLALGRLTSTQLKRG